MHTNDFEETLTLRIELQPLMLRNLLHEYGWMFNRNSQIRGEVTRSHHTQFTPRLRPRPRLRQSTPCQPQYSSNPYHICSCRRVPRVLEESPSNAQYLFTVSIESQMHEITKLAQVTWLMMLSSIWLQTSDRPCTPLCSLPENAITFFEGRVSMKMLPLARYGTARHQNL